MKHKAFKLVDRKRGVVESLQNAGYIHLAFADDDAFLKGKTFYMITAWDKTYVQIQRVPHKAKQLIMTFPEVIEHFRPIRRKEKIKSLLKYFNNPIL